MLLPVGGGAGFPPNPPELRLPLPGSAGVSVLFRAKLGKARVILKGGCEEQGAKIFFFFLSFLLGDAACVCLSRAEIQVFGADGLHLGSVRSQRRASPTLKST